MKRSFRMTLLALAVSGFVVPAVHGSSQSSVSTQSLSPLARSIQFSHAQPAIPAINQWSLDGTQPPAPPQKPLALDGTQPPAPPQKPLFLRIGIQPLATPQKPLNFDGTQPPAPPQKP